MSPVSLMACSPVRFASEALLAELRHAIQMAEAEQSVNAVERSLKQAAEGFGLPCAGRLLRRNAA